MAGRILAMNENNGAGYRPILCVQSRKYIEPSLSTPQSTVLAGEQLLSHVPSIPLFNQWLANLKNVPAPWVQARSLEQENLETYMMKQFPQALIEPVLEQDLVLMACGFNPLGGGYWVQFQGIIQLFSQPDWWVEHHE